MKDVVISYVITPNCQLSRLVSYHWTMAGQFIQSKVSIKIYQICLYYRFESIKLYYYTFFSSRASLSRPESIPDPATRWRHVSRHHPATEPFLHRQKTPSVFNVSVTGIKTSPYYVSPAGLAWPSLLKNCSFSLFSLFSFFFLEWYWFV